MYLHTYTLIELCELSGQCACRAVSSEQRHDVLGLRAAAHSTARGVEHAVDGVYIQGFDWA